MTLEEIKASDREMLIPNDIAAALGVNPHSIRLQAQGDPGKLGFNVCVVGSRTLIPRLPFLNFVLGENANDATILNEFEALNRKIDEIKTMLEQLLNEKSNKSGE